MVTVILGGPLRAAAGDPGPIEIEAGTVRDVTAYLAETYPRLRPILDKGISVAIDGQLHRGAGYQRLPAGSEVHILVPLTGGF